MVLTDSSLAMMQSEMAVNKQPVALSTEQGRPQLRKSPTGIAGFDQITLGGLPTGRPTLICGGPGCGKTLFGVTFLVKGAVTFGEPGVLIAFEDRAADIAANVASLGYDVDPPCK